MPFRDRAPSRGDPRLQSARLRHGEPHQLLARAQSGADALMRQLLLAGVGHAHLDLLASLTRGIPEGWTVTAVTSQPDFHYSGMLPAIVAGEVPAAAADVPVARIARAAGMAVHVARVTALDVSRRLVTLDSGAELSYDLLSLDVGSVPAAFAVPGAAEHACAMRPFASALRLTERLDASIAAWPRGAPISAVVVGAGAAGVEIAFAVRARIAKAGRVPLVAIIDAATAPELPLAGFTQRMRLLAGRALASRGIAFVSGTVREVLRDGVRVETAEGVRTITSLATAWVTGPAAPPWLAGSGLDCDERGYPFADETLALTADGSVFGAGDCVTLRHAPATVKAGVYAVRMAPILAANVQARMTGTVDRVRYSPQQDFLALLSTGDGAALLRWRGVALEARWAQHLKRWIDERYLRRYVSLAR